MGYGGESTTFEVIFDLESQTHRIEQIDAQAAAPDFWNDAPRAQALLREQARARATVEEWRRLARVLEDAETLLELSREAGDAASGDEAAQLAERLTSALSALELAQMLNGPHDRMGALVSINSGAGGTDNGPPGLRPQYHPNYYGAFVIDPDGHNLEAVCHAPEPD